MKQERIEELLKAARERLHGPPGARQIQVLPEEMLELLDGVTVEVDAQQSVASLSQPVMDVVGVGSKWDAVGRIAASYITKMAPPQITPQKVTEFVSETIAQIEGRI